MALFNACPLVVLRALLRLIAFLSSGSIVSKDSSMSIGALTIRIDVLILASEAKMLVSIRFPSLSTTRILYCCGLTVCQASICVCDAVSDTSGTMVTSFEDSSILYQSNYTNSRGTAHNRKARSYPSILCGLFVILSTCASYAKLKLTSHWFVFFDFRLVARVLTKPNAEPA